MTETSGRLSESVPVVQDIERMGSPSAPAPKLGSLTSRIRIWLINAAVLLTFLVVWEIVANLYQSPFIPGPSEVLRAFITLLSQGDINGQTLWAHIAASMLRVLAGFAMGVVTGVPLGLLMGLYPTFYQGSRCLTEPLRFIPPLAWIPMALVILTGFSRYVFIIWLGVFFPIFLATLLGVPRVETLHTSVAKVHGASRAWIVRKVVIPSILPDILGGMRVGLGVGWMCIVAAEMIGGGTTGLGKLIIEYAELMRMSEIVVGMIVIGLCGFVMNEIIILIEKRLFRWRWEVQI